LSGFSQANGTPVQGETLKLQQNTKSKHTYTSPCMLSYESANNLGIIKIIQSIAESNRSKEAFKRQYPELFSGKIGCLKDFMLELHEDKSIKPTKQYHYRIPYHVQDQVAEHLDRDEASGLIERATGPATWISASHVVPKKDPTIVRLVIEPRQ